MDKRSWLWKKKSSDKQGVEKVATAALDVSNAAPEASETQVDKSKQDNKKPKYVQLSMESYTHLTGLEDQLKSYEDQVKTFEDEVTELNVKLSETHSEIANKEMLVKQHAKVAEEAVSGWEKAEAEAAALKTHLESVTLLKLTAEDRASHLDGALKECMRQMRNLKEEHDQKLHEVVINKTKLFDKMKLELETKISNLDQELLRSAAENAALSRSLQERSNMIIKVNEEKSQAETEIQLLKSKIEACEKEVNSHKYELHIARKEVEIRNEEKNMSVRSAEVANKQHLEGVKKIAKLEAECQRLRGLVRKRLPGPAALAQMKLEVENMGRDYGESRLKRYPVRPPTPLLSQMPEFGHGNAHKYQKDNELLAERLLAMEEEMKMLTEALAKRNSELQASRCLFAQTASKLQSLEAQLQVDGEQRSCTKSDAPVEGFCSQSIGNPPSFTSISEDGNDDGISCAGSWAPGVMSELALLKKSENTSPLDLMDDFLEMEKLAYLSNGTVPTTGNIGNGRSAIVKQEESLEFTMRTEPVGSEEGCGSEAGMSSKDDATVANPQLLADKFTFKKLQLQISSILESMSAEKDKDKVLENLRCTMQDMHDSLQYLSTNSAVEIDLSDPMSDTCSHAEDAKVTATEAIPMSGDVNLCMETTQTINHELENAISQILDFFTILGREVKAISIDGDELNKKLDSFSAKYGEYIKSGINLNDFVLQVSYVLSKASELQFNVMGFKSSQVETGSFDCIDKIALPENKNSVDLSGDRYPNGCTHFSDSASDPDVPHDGNLVPTSESTNRSWKCSLEEFEQLKLDKENLAADLARCTENLEVHKCQSLETQQHLSEVHSQLTIAQKANSLLETQLKCMAESYKSLETRADGLENKVKHLQEAIENFENELQEERKSHQDALARCTDLQDQLQRLQSSDCNAAADSDDKISQEKELAAAAEKLAECQETIFLLGRQLKAMRPQTEFLGSLNNGRTQKADTVENEPTVSGTNIRDVDSSLMDNTPCLNLHGAGSESPLDMFNAPFSPSDSEAHNLQPSPVSKYSKHRPTNSGSSSASSTPTPEKQARGFSRFFSTKAKNGQL
ncbi:filament-like plant protein 6-like [Dorcoceras hygrometricum]|uniref:Filament-like plant protein 6-like n=1 Tax=Dorcoceras hygrometricum TaxID=472368 RepID=A0A2Z7A4Q8_9LAMI|nr:filament-like plant protein 6-like [Dorcoceras hygrometricum]